MDFDKTEALVNRAGNNDLKKSFAAWRAEIEKDSQRRANLSALEDEIQAIPTRAAALSPDDSPGAAELAGELQTLEATARLQKVMLETSSKGLEVARARFLNEVAKIFEAEQVRAEQAGLKAFESLRPLLPHLRAVVQSLEESNQKLKELSALSDRTNNASDLLTGLLGTAKACLWILAYKFNQPDRPETWLDSSDEGLARLRQIGKAANILGGFADNPTNRNPLTITAALAMAELLACSAEAREPLK